MSLENLKRFGEKISEDIKVREKVKEIGFDPEEIIAYGKELGLDFNQEDMEALAKESGMESDELSEEQLEKISGGFITATLGALGVGIGVGMCVGMAASEW